MNIQFIKADGGLTLYDNAICIHVHAYIQSVLTEFLLSSPTSCKIHITIYSTLCCLLHVNHVPGICYTCILLSAKTLCHQILHVC